mgnify:CR=1 FL=1
MSDYETTQKRRNIIVGFFVIIALISLVWLLFKFGELPTVVRKVGSYDVLVRLPMATGIERNTSVRFCGYQVGSVTRIDPPKPLPDLNTRERKHQTVIVLSIDKQFDRIPADVEIQLVMRGLSSSYIELVQTVFDANADAGPFLTGGMERQGVVAGGSEFIPEEIQTKIMEVAADLRVLIGHVNTIIGDPENQNHLKESLVHIAEVTAKATGIADQTRKALDDANDTLREFRLLAETGRTAIAGLDEKLDKAVVALAGAGEELSETLSQMRLILIKVNEGDGTAGRFINDGKLYESLLENTEQLSSVLKDIRAFLEQSRDKGMPIKLK